MSSSDVRPNAGCEGRCGCWLARLGHGWWETAPSPIPALGEWEFVAEHTPDRCVAIRTLREAAETVIAPELVAVVDGVEDGIDVLVARAGEPGGDSRWAEVSWRVTDVVGAPRAELDRIRQSTANTLDAVLSGARPTRRYPAGPAVIARVAGSRP